MSVAKHVYIGEVTTVRMLNADNPSPKPRTRYQWKCSCGATNSSVANSKAHNHGIPDNGFWHFSKKADAEDSLDKHLRTHNRDHEFSLDEEEKNDPVIAVEGAPQLLTAGDKVIGVSGGLWTGKMGLIEEVGEGFTDQPRQASTQDSILVTFLDPLEVPASCFQRIEDHPLQEGDRFRSLMTDKIGTVVSTDREIARSIMGLPPHIPAHPSSLIVVAFDDEPDVHVVTNPSVLVRIPAREDDKRVPDVSPNNDATHDVQHDIPHDQGDPGQRPSSSPHTINHIGSHIVVPCAFPVNKRWGAFTDEEKTILKRLLSFGEGTRIYADHHPTYDRLSTELDQDQ